MGLPIIASYFTVAILLAPALIEAWIVPIAAHLMIIWFACSSGITPPVCPMAYVAAGIGESNPMRTGFTAMRLGMVAFLAPMAFVFRPELLLMGAPVSVILTVAMVIMGVGALSIGLVGYLLLTLSWLQRTLFTVAGGMLLFIPEWVANVVAILLLAIAVLPLYKRPNKL